MTRLLSLILILFFITTAIFGAAGMYEMYEMSGNETPCAVPMIGGASCPTDQLLFAVHHLGTYELFSQGVPIFASLLFITLILTLAGRTVLPFLHKPAPKPLRLYLRNKKENKPVYLGLLTKWLSLFELSPSF